MTFVKIIGMMLVGFVFGFCMQKAQVYKPELLIQQFTFESWLTFKIFLALAAFSCFTQAFMQYQDKEQLNSTRLKEPQSQTRVATGTAILGAGMTVAGSCPGQVYVLMGSAQSYFVSIYFGMIVACFTQYITEENNKLISGQDTLQDNTQNKKENNNDREIVLHDNNKETKQNETGIEIKVLPNTTEFLDEYVNISQPILSIILGILLVIFIGSTEQFWPWELDVIDSSQYWDQSTWNIFTQKAWPPWLGGAIVGIMQLPSRYIIGEGLGSATSTYGMVSTILEQMGYESKFSFYKSEFAALQFVKMLFGVTIGSFTSAQLGSDLASMNVQKEQQSIRGFIGGFLLIQGSRMAGGCTSGHGLTGFSNLNMKSIIGAISIFTSAILLAQIFKIVRISI